MQRAHGSSVVSSVAACRSCRRETFPLRSGPHQREHLSVIEKSALRRPRPMRADDDLFAESNNRPDGELVYVEAPACFGEGLGHEFLVKRPHARDDRQLSTPVPLRAPHPVS